jgi:sialate O-acetylesterase
MIKKILVFLFCALFHAVNAKVVLPDLFSDNMVVKQNALLRLWGTAKPNKVVYLKQSWSKHVYKFTTKNDGKWSFSVNTPKGSFNKEWISIDDGQITTIKNVLIGEVWFCSGQSNMEMTFKGFKDQPIEFAAETMATADSENGIRMLRVKRNAPAFPVSDAQGKWMSATPINVENFSATAYFFALRLKSILNVPVGIINSSWGGSSVEGWLTKSIVSNYPDIDLNASFQDDETWKKPYVMFNGMAHPYKRFAVSGFLWYQGESNVSKPENYAYRLTELIKLWRSEWNLGNLPFFIVEIAPYSYNKDHSAAKLREAQFEVAQAMDNCEIIGTNDLVYEDELTVIHPKQKKQIGERLANMALKTVYQKDSICAFFPFFKQYSIQNNTVQVELENCQKGIKVRQSDSIKGFEIAGEDQLFYPAEAIIQAEKQSILVSSGNVAKPIAVRYCFKNESIGNIVNDCELPLFPFRTDNW